MKLNLKPEIDFIYRTFAREWISCEDQQDFWQLQADTSKDMARIIYSEDMIEEVEKEIMQLFEVAGRLGLNKDILDHIHDQERIKDAKEALA